MTNEPMVQAILANERIAEMTTPQVAEWLMAQFPETTGSEMADAMREASRRNQSHADELRRHVRERSQP